MIVIQNDDRQLVENVKMNEVNMNEKIGCILTSNKQLKYLVYGYTSLYYANVKNKQMKYHHNLDKIIIKYLQNMLIKFDYYRLIYQQFIHEDNTMLLRPYQSSSNHDYTLNPLNDKLIKKYNKHYTYRK